MKVLIVYDERVIAREVLNKLKEALGDKYTVKVESVINCHGCDKELNYSYDEKELR
jgi:hypothetical protein